MNYRTLGKTGLRVSEAGMGCWAIGGNSYGATDDQVSLAAIRRALELGCVFFDTADVYGFGHSEELLGQAVGDRTDVIIASKVGYNMYTRGPGQDFSPAYIRHALEHSLKRLRREAIDVYQLHNPPRRVIAEGRVFETLEQLSQEGKIRFFGVSLREARHGLAAIEDGRPQTLQVVFNLLDGEPSVELLPAASSANVGIIAREPLVNGFLTGKYQRSSSFQGGDTRRFWSRELIAQRVGAAESLRFLAREGRTLAQAALRFVLDHDAVSAVIPGCKSPAQVEENLAASDLAPLSVEERSRVGSALALT